MPLDRNDHSQIRNIIRDELDARLDDFQNEYRSDFKELKELLYQNQQLLEDIQEKLNSLIEAEGSSQTHR